jgi:AraC-like DNA-binding protein
VREATQAFRDLTGFTAIASFADATAGLDSPGAIPPPLHPLCVSRPHAAAEDVCLREWYRHVGRSLRSRAPQHHVCPAGLRCSCVPIDYRGALVGVTKCVAAPGADGRRFTRALHILQILLAKAGQDCCVAVQGREIDGLRRRLSGLQRAVGSGVPARLGVAQAVKTVAADGARHELIDRALTCIGRRYLEHGTTLHSISSELGVTEKHLTRCFTMVVGQRMHAYLLQLRVQHACREMLMPGKSLKQVAYESGFRTVSTFRRSFQRFAGVSPDAYRNAFGRS